MQPAEYYVRLISHKCDRQFRKEIVQKICDDENRFTGGTVSVLHYGVPTTASVYLIDDDHDRARNISNPNIHTILVMDLRKYTEDGIQLQERIKWFRQAVAGCTAWCFTGPKCPAIVMPNDTRMITDAGWEHLTNMWCEYIEGWFGVRGIQITEKTFYDLTSIGRKPVELKKKLVSAGAI